MRWLTPVVGAVIATSCLLPELTKVDSFDDDGAGASGGEDVSLGGGGTTAGSAGAASSGRGGSSSASGGSMTSGGAVGTGGESGAGDSSGVGGSAGTSGATTGGKGGTATGGKGGTATGGKGGTGGAAGSGNTGGMGAAGAGNTAGAANGGSANGGTAGSGQTTCGSSWDVTADGYVFSPGVQTCWQGHAFTRYMGTALIAPTNFTACGSPCALCADGSVGTAGGYASLGFYLNQPVENPTPAPWTPVSSGITLFFTNNAGSPMQLVLEAQGGQRWCYDLTGITHPVFVTWGLFNTECIGGTGAPYASQPVMSLQIVVPSTSNTTPFDFCLDRAAVGN